MRIHIQGAKRSQGMQGEARYEAEKGADRVVEVDSPEVVEVAERRGGYFQPESSRDALRMRLAEARRDIPGGENIRFYSFRHSMKSHLEQSGTSSAEIARVMGHQSERSQKEYGIKR